MGNIVKANCGKARDITTAPLWQYDYGQILLIEGIELPTAYQVHFSNEPYGSSTTSVGTEDGVAIPNAYLQGGGDVYAWLYLQTGENDGETVLMIRIPVRPRAAITNETPTPTEQSEIDELIAALNLAVEAAEDAEDAAEGHSEDAEAWAVGKRGGVDVGSTDDTYHNNSKYYAGEAEDSAEAAAGSATAAGNAQTAAETAQGKAEDAQEAAETAKGKAEDAQTAAETAQGLAEDAQEAAETAQGKAEDAQEAAETAQGKAEDAQEAAEAAQTAAETAQGLAEAAQDAAEDAQEAAEAASDAIQDMGVAAQTLAAGSSAAVTKSVDPSTGAVTLTFGIPKGDTGSTGPTGYPTDEQVATAIAAVVTNPDSPPLDRTLSSSSSAAPADMVGDLKSAINTYLEVDFANLFNKNTATGSRRISTSTGDAGSADAQFTASDYIPVTAGKEYVINFSYYSSGAYGMAFYNSSKTFISGRKQSNSTSSSTNKFVFTAPTNAAYIRITCASGVLSVDNVVVSLNNGTISERFDIDDLLGEKIKPLYTATYELDSTSVKTFSECSLENAHRYTVIKKETSSRAITTVGCIKSGSFVGTGKFDYKNPHVTSFTTTNSGSLAAGVNGAPVSGVLSVFDTTGDDTLKSYLENLMAIPGEETNLMPSKALNRIIGIETDSHTTGKVIFVGDSQTQKNYFTSAFKTLYAVSNNENDVDYYGYGGAGAREIAGFQGGLTLFAKPFTIPATTTAVEIELYTDTEPGHACATQSVKGLTNIEIGGVVGDISYNSTDGKNYFTRDDAGESVVIDRPIIVRSSLSYLTHSTLIVEVGTNDTTGATEESLSNMLKSVIRSMIRHNASEQYIVLGLTAKVENLDVAEVNNALAEEFGNHFIDDRSYLIEYGLEDEEITPTAQDETDIANGDIPSSLRDDAVHFNQHGGNVIGKLVYDRGVYLGYWK